MGIGDILAADYYREFRRHQEEIIRRELKYPPSPVWVGVDLASDETKPKSKYSKLLLLGDN